MTPTPDEARASAKAWAGIVACLIGAAACFTAAWGATTGCLSTPAPATVRADARAAVQVATDAIVAGYQLCGQAAQALDASAGAQLRADCHAALDPAAAGAEIAAQLVDAWDDASQAAYGCAMTSVLAGLDDFTEIAGITVPPLIVDALTLVEGIAPSCAAPFDAVAPPVDAAPVAMPPLTATSEVILIMPKSPAAAAAADAGGGS